MGQSLKGEPGKSYNQRLRSYLVMQYFLKNADERHPVSMQEKLATHITFHFLISFPHSGQKFNL